MGIYSQVKIRWILYGPWILCQDPGFYVMWILYRPGPGVQTRWKQVETPSPGSFLVGGEEWG